ncbi:HAD family hydrolase [Blautia sp. HCP3S3_C4]|uniref:HAD family hydrolase n=1 Tax=Blautia sp. HCP3S3_C4 TaxID=3438911 RepID=UPI003F8A7D46
MVKQRFMHEVHLIDDIIITDELGGPQFRKPCDIAFRIMQNRWRLPYEQIVYVGDNPNKDFQACRQLGMRWKYLRNEDGLYFDNSKNDVQEIDMISELSF